MIPLSVNLIETPSLNLLDVLDIVDVAVATVSRRLPAFVSREDLTSVGKLTLVTVFHRCAGTTDEIRAQCFVRVRSAILDEIRRQDPISRRRRDAVRSVERASVVFESREKRAPSVTDLAGEIGIAVRDVRRAIATLEASAQDESFDWNAVIDEGAIIPSSGAEISELREHLAAVLAQLTTGQALAVRRLYLDDATLEEVGAELGVSTERARQLREAGIAKLRILFAALGKCKES